MKKQMALIVASIMTVVMAATAVAAVPEAAGAGNDKAGQGWISVHGEASVKVKPDTAIVSLGVATKGKTADAASKENAAAMNKVIAAVKAQGIENAAIESSNLTVYPVYDYGTMAVPEEEPKMSAYEVINQVSVTIDNLDKLKDVVNAAMKAGANTLNNVRYDIQNRESHELKAIEKAMKKAENKAKAIASISGLKLGRIISVSESGAYSYDAGYYSVVADDGLGMGDANIGDTLQPTTISISGSVSVTYAVE